MSDRTDLTLDIDGVTDEDLSRVWSTLQAVAQGFALDGHDVSIRTYRDKGDGDYDETFHTVGPEGESV